MLDIDIMEWGCGLAEGYQIVKIEEDFIRFKTDTGIIESESFDWDNMAYPLFLQRVIEGINKAYMEERQDRYFVDMGYESLDVWDDSDETVCFFGQYELFDSIDQAKEQAIKYIWENLNV